jgi:hypothetical protein
MVTTMEREGHEEDDDGDDDDVEMEEAGAAEAPSSSARASSINNISAHTHRANTSYEYAPAAASSSSSHRHQQYQHHQGFVGGERVGSSAFEADSPPPATELVASTAWSFGNNSTAAAPDGNGGNHAAAASLQQQQEAEEEVIDMGYEDCAPSVRQQRRRGSMSHDEEKQRRASIKAIMADPALSPMAKRKSIQHLMDGRRNSIEHRRLSMGSRTSLVSSNGGNGPFPYPSSRRGSLTASVHSVSSHLSVDPALFAASGGGGGSGSGAPGSEEPPFGIDVVDMGYGGNTPAAAAAAAEDHQLYHDYYHDDDEDTNAGPSNHHRHHYRAHEDSMMNHLNLSRVGFSLCNEQTRRAEVSRPQCQHYQRNCTIIAACCGMAFGCRICHDDCPSLPPKINNGGRRYHRSASLPGSFTSMHAGTNGAASGANGTSGGVGVGSAYMMDDMDTSHQIDRFAIREVICRECYTRQSSKTCVPTNKADEMPRFHCAGLHLTPVSRFSPYLSSPCYC